MPRTKRRKRKIPYAKIFVFVGILTIGIFGGYYLYKWYKKHKYNEIPTYEGFEIYIPKGKYIHGIDVSHHQKEINWEAVADMQIDTIKLDFAFIKCTEGTDFLDKNYYENWEKISQTRLKRGVYHFFNPLTDPTQQALFFLSHAELQKGDFAPVLDIELNGGLSKEELLDRCMKWIKIVEKKFNTPPIIYTYLNFYEKYFVGTPVEKYPLWVAHYYEPEKPRTAKPWVLWQHNDAGRVNGISRKVDFNVLNAGSFDEVKHLFIQ